MSATRTYLLCAALGFVSAWYVQGLRTESAVNEVRDGYSSERDKAWNAYSARIESAESEKAKAEAALNEFIKNESLRNSSIGAGVKRVYVRATCPGLPTSESDTGRIEGGAAELDPAYRQTLSDLRAGVETQRALLNKCRAALGVNLQ